MNDPSSRISDDDRQRAVKALGEHYAVGRLQMNEFEERAQQAWVSTTVGDLDELFADLPLPRYETGLAVRESNQDKPTSRPQTRLEPFIKQFPALEVALWSIVSLWIPFCIVILGGPVQIALAPFFLMMMATAVYHSIFDDDDDDADNKKK